MPVQLATFEQFIVRTEIEDSSGIHHANDVGVEDRREAVGDRQRGAVLDELGDRLVDAALAVRVDLRGRLVEDQNRRIAQDRAGDGDPLLLPARKRRPVLSDHRFVTVRQVADELVHKRLLRSRQNVRLLRPPEPVSDVLGDGGVEQDRVLRNEGYLPPHRADGILRDIAPVDKDLTFCGIDQARQQRDQRCLTAPVGSHDGEGLAGVYLEVDILERVLGSTGVAKAHIAQLDAPGVDREHWGSG